jgi:surfeit locus 1 family protein
MLRRILVTIAVVAATAVCVRLGFWQLARLGEKKALNAAMRERLAAAPVPLRAGDDAGAVRGRRVVANGAYDERRHILLYGRERSGVPGVHVVTPLVLPGDSVAVLVDRGWLAADDAETARPQDYPEHGTRDVVGVADTLARSGRAAPRAIESDSLLLLSMRQPDLGSLAGRFPYALAPVWIHQLPGPGVPDQPARDLPRPLDESMHIGYAIQWFAIAAIILIGSIALARRPR